MTQPQIEDQPGEPVMFEWVRDGAVREYHPVTHPIAIQEMREQVARREAAGDVDGWWVEGGFEQWQASRQGAGQGEETAVSTTDDRGERAGEFDETGQPVRRDDTPGTDPNQAGAGQGEQSSTTMDPSQDQPDQGASQR